MKKFRLLICLFLFPAFAFAQIPNAGFENWTNGNPDNWLTTNISSFINITQTSDAHSGSYAIKGEVISVATAPYNPFLSSGSDGEGFTINQKYMKISGYYKLTSVSNDVFRVNIGMVKNGQAIAAGSADFNASSNYTYFEVPMVYITDTVPDTCIIQFLIAGPNGNDYHIGSYFILDDISLSTNPSAVKSNDQLPGKFMLYQNYPNPFNPSTTIEYSIAQRSSVKLKIYDILGDEITTLVDEELPAGNYKVKFDAKYLPSGIYVYKLQAGRFISSKKLILVK